MIRRALALVALVAVPASAAPRRPFSIPDLYRLKGVEEPALAPDARWIVYKVTSSDLKEVKRWSNLWRVRPDGSEAQALTFEEKTDSSPALSADGKLLAFLSTRSGENQVWTMSTSGGEPQKRTDFPGGVSSFLLSRDARRIVFAADVWPECGAEAACNKKKDEARDKSKLKARVADRLLYRHWNEWRDAKRAHVLLLDTADGSPKDLTPGDFESPVYTVGGPRGYDLSPDGKELVFSSNRERDEASTTNADLWAVSVDAPAEALKTPRPLSAANPAWDGSPLYSPDGRSVAYRTQKVAGWEADRARIAVIDRASGASRILTESFDNTINELAWSADSRKIYFTADVKGRTPLHELDVASGKVRVLTDVGLLDAFQVAPDGTWAAVSRRRVGSPSELWRIDFAAGSASRKERRLTTHNAAVEAEVDIRPAEEMTVEGAGGKPVQVFVVKPSGFDPAKRYPVILNVHGGPQSQWADAFRGDWQVYPDYLVVFPNPHGSTGFGEAYTAAISGDWDGKVMEDIEKVTDAVSALPYVDKDRIGLMGWSWGGYAVMWLQGHSTRYKAMASMMGVYDLRSMASSTEELWFPTWDLKGVPWEHPEVYRRASPSDHVPSFKTPCLVITGEKDYRVPYTQSLMFFTDLQKRKVPSRLVVLENAGHWPAWYEMALYYAAHLDWFHEYLGGSPPPWDPKELARGASF
jgi:dipeptidyl aminopeptidase/acylaminoacyl peptidase